MGVLSGVALLNYAYEVMLTAFDTADTPDCQAHVIQALKVMSHKTGLYGMLGGQSVDVENDGKPMSRTEAYRVVVNGEDAGYAFKIVAGGSQGDIEMIVGVDADLAITGISVVDAAETSGIGTKVIANEATTAGTGALDQFVGKSGAGSLVVKTNIDAVSGATVTTKGITKGANAALAAAEAMA